MRALEQILSVLRDFKKINTDAELASYLGVKPNTIATWKARKKIPFAVLVAKCEEDGINLDWLLTGEGGKYKSRALSIKHLKGVAQQLAKNPREEFSQLPAYDIQASAGHGAFLDSERIIDYLTFSTKWLRQDMGLDPAKLAIITAVGDSMEPTIKENDMLMVDIRQNPVRDGAIYVIRVDHQLSVKRLQIMYNGDINITSDNPIYEKQTVPKKDLEELNIIGRVVWIGKKV